MVETEPPSPFHGSQVHTLISMFVKKVGLSKQAATQLHHLTRFHDIGKLGVPPSILHKPDQLTEAEYTIIKQHSLIGYKIARLHPRLQPIGELILTHHEWWNGHGYPLGLRGKEIPWECRVLSIVDAYDAMVSNRPYRKSMPPQAAKLELARCAGSQFDPDLVDQFIHSIRHT